jgi:putative MATE family efflux protein
VGGGDRDGANRTLNQSFFLAVLFGLLGTPIALVLLPWGVRLLGLTGFSGDSAIHFLQPIVLLVTAQMITQAGLACLVGAGDTRTGPIVLSTVALVNIPLAWVCFHGLGPIRGMGFFGIGLGTALSHSIGCLIVVAVLLRGRYGLHLSLAQLRPNPGLIGRILRVSVPASIDIVSIGLCQFWFLALVNALGDVAATAHGIAIRCEGLGYMSGQAFATAAAALVGQNLGAKRYQAATHSAWVALGLGCLTMSLMGVMFFTFARPMFQFFSPHEHQLPVVDAGVPVLRLVAFAMPALSLIIILSGALRGAGDTRFPILLTWIGFLVIRIPLAYLLTRDTLDLGQLGQVSGWNWGLLGAWLAMFVDLLVRGVLFLWRFMSGRWQLVQV